MRDVPYNITTDAGRRLWTYLNNQHGSGTWGLAGELIPLIEREARERGAALDELQRLAEETGEYETFDNPLVDGETASPEIELGVAALELGVFRERARVVALLRKHFPRGWDYAERDPIESVIAVIEGESLAG